MANAIRSLTLDAIHVANSGHPGMPLGMADVAAVLFADFLKFNSSDPLWVNRDRFVLSAGHGSMLLYSVLYLTGYIQLDDLKKFRKLGSVTPGHPEHCAKLGIENTSGPLGQGFATAVGISLAEKILNHKSNSVIDHYTYVIASDGCLMEGINHEAASLAGHLKLNKLIVFFDDNNISIDGSIMLASSEDTQARFCAYNWNVISIDGHNYEEIKDAIKSAKCADKPSLICCKTTIGKGLSMHLEGSENSHSYSPKIEDLIMAKQRFNVASSTQKDALKQSANSLHLSTVLFDICDSVQQMWQSTNKVEEYNMWQKSLSDQDILWLKHLLKEPIDAEIFSHLENEIMHNKYNESTRKSSGRVIEFLSKQLDFFIGGSADLGKSNCIKTDSSIIISHNNYGGNYIHYGIREHAMVACMNGLALHSNVIAYGGTFLIFSDYARPAIRMAALMKIRTIFIMTHDSIGVGEDGPTHQPIEHLASFRVMPNIYLFRPCDAEEVLQCWKLALNAKNPSIIALSRQDLNFIDKKEGSAKCHLGAYIIDECQSPPDFIIFATGSEVAIALKAKSILKDQSFAVRVISVPCTQLFFQSDPQYIQSILGKNKQFSDSEHPKPIKVAIEAASSFGWEKFIGDDGIFIGIDTFGSSAPYSQLYQHYKITAEEVVKRCIDRLSLAQG